MPLRDYLPSRNTLKKWFLVGSNTLLNIATPLTVLNRIAATFDVDESTGEVREHTRFVIVGIYAALALGMELRSAKRTTEEVMAAAASPEDGKELGDGKSLERRRWHNNALAFDSWYKTIGRSIAVLMVMGELGAGRVASTLVAVGLGVGGYMHAQHPRLHPADIIHRTDVAPGHITPSWGGLASALLWVGSVISAFDNAERYTAAYKIAAHEVSDIFSTSDAGPYLDDHVLFYLFSAISSLATIYSKFLLARNRSADIWQKHAAASSRREWLQLVDVLAVVGAAVHTVAAYCNDSSLTQGLVPEEASLTGSILFPSLGFIGTYATNADYLGWEVNENGLLVRSSPLRGPQDYQQLPAEEKKQDSVSPQAPDHPASVIYEVGTDEVRGGEVLIHRGQGAPTLGEQSSASRNSLLVDPEQRAHLREELRRSLATRDTRASRDLLSPSRDSNGELSDNGRSEPPSPRSSATPPRFYRPRPSRVTTLSPVPEDTLAAGRPNGNLSPPPGPVQATASTTPVSSPLSPQPATEAKKTGLVGQLFRFLGSGGQPASTTTSALLGNTEAAYGAVPPTEDSEQDSDKSCVLQ